MAAGSATQVLRIPGRLILGPSDLSAAYPYGGTELGWAKQQVFRYGVGTYSETASEWGVVVRTFYTGSKGVLSAYLRAWDVTAIGTMFPNVATGTSGAPLLAPVVNSGTRAGTALSGSVILLAPLAPDLHPAVLLYNALPMPEEAAALTYSRKDEATIGVQWYAAPDASGRPYAVGRMEDLTL